MTSEPAFVSDPGAVWRVIHGYTGYWVAVTGVRLGVFDALADGPLDQRELAGRCAANEERVAVIADALAAIGLLGRDADGYHLTDAAAAHLVAGRPGSMGELLVWSPGPAANWPALDRTVRGNPPPAPVEDDPTGFYSHLVEATFPSQLAVARGVLGLLRPRTGARLLELGAGRGPWTTALLAADPGASAVLNDLAGIIENATCSLGPLADRCAFVPGDYLSVPLPPGPYDLVVLGHVLRAEPDARAGELVARSAACLAPNGRLLIAEYLGGRDPVAHPQPALLAATMLAATVHGRICCAGQIEAWLAAAGCQVVARPEPIANTDIIVAAPAARSGGAP